MSSIDLAKDVIAGLIPDPSGAGGVAPSDLRDSFDVAIDAVVDGVSIRNLNRIGDNPHNFSLGTATIVVGTEGNVARSVGSATVTSKRKTALEPDRVYDVSFAYRRTTNSTDPSNDAVSMGVVYYNSNGDVLSTVTLFTEDNLSTGNGRQENLFRLSRASVDGAALIPSTARYAAAFIQTFGTSPVTVLEICGITVVPRLSAPFISFPEGFQWPTETFAGGKVERMFYVSQGGSDSNNGESLAQPVRNIEAARDLVEASNEPATIYVYPGTYETQGHIDFPDNCTGVISATAARSTKVIPAAGYEERNVFRMGNGGYVQGFSFEGGWRVDSLDNPTEGFAVSFRPGAVINRTVYAHNIVMYRTGDPVLIPPPLDRANQNPLVGRGGGVALADGSVASPYSVFPQIMLWGATPVNPNGIGYCAKRGAFINGINAVALWSHKQYLALDGGEMILTNCASQAGDWTLWSEGSRKIVKPFRADNAAIAEWPTAATAIEANATAIKNAMWNYLVSEGYINGLSTESAAALEASTRKDADLLLLTLRYDLTAGQQESTALFTKGMYDWDANFVGKEGSLYWFTLAWQKIRDEINAILGAGGPQAMVTALVNDVLIATTSAATLPTGIFPSKITAAGHQWNETLTGVNGRAFSRAPLEVPESIVERALGQVIYSGIDASGKQYFTGGALVNPLTGQFEGPPVDRTILPRARRAATIVGGYA